MTPADDLVTRAECEEWATSPFPVHEDDVARLLQSYMWAMEHVEELASAGVTFADERVSFEEVQVSSGSVERANALLRRYEGQPTTDQEEPMTDHTPDDASADITPEEITRLTELCEKATEPTHVDRYEHGGARVCRIVGDDRTLIADFYGKPDREFYIESRSALPRLLSALSRERATNAELLAVLRGLITVDEGGNRCLTASNPWEWADLIYALLCANDKWREQQGGET